LKLEKEKPVVLSADDDPNAHILLKRAFAKAGIDAVLMLVSDGSELIDYLAGEGKFADRAGFPLPDLLLLDLKMPRISGFGALEYIRSETRFKELQVIVFSTSNQECDIKKAYALGCNCYFVKPCQFEELVRLMRQINTTFLRKEEPAGKSCEKLTSSFYRDACPAERTDLPMKRSATSQKNFAASPEMFKSLVEQVKDYAIFMLDMEGRILTWNEGARRVKGYETSEIIGKPFSVLYPGGDVEANKPQFELRMAREMGRYEEQGWRVRKDGARFWANVIITPLRAPDGSFVGYATITRDMTQAKLQEESFQRLLESEERFRLLVEQVKDYAIFMLDPKGFVISWNQGAKRIKGYNSDEIIGKHFSIFYTPDAIASDHPAKELAIAIREGRYEEEGWRVRKDGTRFWANVVITALWDKRGNLNGFAKVTRDLTQRKFQEDSLRQKTDALESFAHTLSHDLRAPLRALSSFAEILREDFEKLPQPERELYLDKIIKSAQSMNQLVDDVLKLSQVTLAAAPEQTVSLSEILDETLALLEVQIKETGAQIKIQTPLPYIKANRTLMVQVFTNLLSNSLKFTRPRQKPKVEISVLEEKAVCRIRFKDDGIGIPEKFLSSIFNVFERGSAAPETGGSGVGLAIVKSAVERIGGNISVRSRENEGSEFTLRLPCDGFAMVEQSPRAD
jgi:PAS domain S-box-containing protein